MASTSSLSSSSLMQMIVAVALVVLASVAPCSEAAVNKTVCLAPITSLLVCRDYVQNGALFPNITCCTALSTVVQQNPLCLCAILDGEATTWLGTNIDLNRSLALPAACAVQPPSILQCLNVTRIVPSPPGPGTYSDASSRKPSPLIAGLLLGASLLSVVTPFKLWQLLF